MVAQGELPDSHHRNRQLFQLPGNRVEHVKFRNDESAQMIGPDQVFDILDVEPRRRQGNQLRRQVLGGQRLHDRRHQRGIVTVVQKIPVGEHGDPDTLRHRDLRSRQRPGDAQLLDNPFYIFHRIRFMPVFAAEYPGDGCGADLRLVGNLFDRSVFH